MFSLESPHQGDSNEYTKYAIFSKKNIFTLNYPKYAAMGFFSQGTPERVQNSHGKRATSVRAIEVLLYNNAITYMEILCTEIKASFLDTNNSVLQITRGVQQVALSHRRAVNIGGGGCTEDISKIFVFGVFFTSQ